MCMSSNMQCYITEKVKKQSLINNNAKYEKYRVPSNNYLTL